MSAAPSDSVQEVELTAEESGRKRMRAELGAYSSHPASAASRIRLIRRLALVPIVTVVGILVWRVASTIREASSLELEALKSAIPNLLNAILDFAPQAIIAVACSIAATLAAILTVRASLVRSAASPARATSFASATLITTTLMAVAVCVLVAWSTSTDLITRSTRWWIVAGSLAPIYLLMGVLDYAEKPADEKSDDSGLWKVLRWSIFTAAALASMLVVIPASAEWLTQKIFASIKGLVNLAGSAEFTEVVTKFLDAGPAALISQVVGMGTALLLILLLSLRVRAIAAEAEKRADEHGKPKSKCETKEKSTSSGCFKPLGMIFMPIRFLLEWIGWMKPKETESKEEEVVDGGLPAPPIEWQKAVIAAAKAGSFELSIEWQPAVAPTADNGRFAMDSEATEFGWLFDGRTPSIDQLAMLEAFQYRWTEHLKAVRDAAYGGDRQSHADLLVECEHGAQAHDAIAACAVLACVARGQRVLVLVSEERQQTELVREMQEKLARYQFDALYRVGCVTRDEVARWCPPVSSPTSRVDGEPPDIAVATLANFEEVFTSGAYEPALLRSFQRSLEVVIVEELDRQIENDHARLHLPFILDKHRLILRTEHRAMQLVVSMSPTSLSHAEFDPDSGAPRSVATSARRKIAERLFGGDGGLDTAPETDGRNAERRRAAHVVYLRARAVGSPATLIFRTLTSSVKDARAWIARRLIEQDQVGILALNTVEGSAAHTERFRSGARRPIMSSVDAMMTHRAALAECRWILVDGVPTGVGLRDLRNAVSQLPQSAMVLVVSEDADLTVAPIVTKPTYPVLPAPSSPALFVAHLRSVVAVLAPDIPIRREDLARFGLGWDDERWASYARAISPRILHENWQLELDGAFSDIVQSEHSIWPAVFIRQQDGLMPMPVDVRAPLRAGFCLVPNKNFIRAGAAPEMEDKRRYATWMTTRGLHLGRTDLAYFKPIAFDAERQRYKALNLLKTSDGTVIDAVPLALDAGDFLVPVRQTRFELPCDMALDGPFTLRTLNAFLFRMRESTSPCISSERIVALATAPADGTRGDRRECSPIEFSLHIGITILAIGGVLPKENFEPTLRARYEGRWDSYTPVGKHPRARDAWGALSRAFTYAIGEVSPSFLQFANAYAFRPPHGVEGATILLVEPASTQGTAIEAIRTILDDTALHEKFLEAFERAAREGLRSPTSMRIDGDETEERKESEPELLKLLDLLRCTPPIPVNETPVEGTSGDARIEHPLSTGELHSDPPSRVAPLIDAAANHRWRDSNASSFDEWTSRASGALDVSPEYGVLIDIAKDLALTETTAYGWHDGLSIDDAAALKAACIAVTRSRSESNQFIYGPDYAAMIERNIEFVRPIAQRLVAIADAAGLTSTRDRVGILTSMVQSFQYELQREGDVKDGKHRCGVQLPVATLYARRGDCDSTSLLIVCLLRATGIARSGIVLVEEPSGGHAMVAVDCPASQGDVRLQCRFGHLLMIEATSPCRLGQISQEYFGRHVTLVAFG